MNLINIVNLKCGGCEQKIKNEMEKNGFSSVDVNVDKQTVLFEGDVQSARKILSRLGYPPADSPEAKSLLKKGKSYISCLGGRLGKS